MKGTFGSTTEVGGMVVAAEQATSQQAFATSQTLESCAEVSTQRVERGGLRVLIKTLSGLRGKSRAML